jgi:tripartite-type tricarboxylate transporter receptor subunit TctC
MKAAAVAAASLLAAWPAASPVSAQSVEEFYKTHPVTIMVGFNVGNIYDTVMRTVARHIGRHIPGNPTVARSTARAPAASQPQTRCSTLRRATAP